VSKRPQQVTSAGLTAEKKVKGRKRHIVVDIMGNILAVCVHSAALHDTKEGINPAAKAYAKYLSIKKFCGDCGYRKSFIENVKNELGLDVDISPKITPTFAIIPKRWIVERTLAWLNHSRRLAKDYEISVASEETFIIISHLRILTRRLASL
jgi:putative transposase